MRGQWLLVLKQLEECLGAFFAPNPLELLRQQLPSFLPSSSSSSSSSS
jgi:hypothetical protein